MIFIKYSRIGRTEDQKCCDGLAEVGVPRKSAASVMPELGFAALGEEGIRINADLAVTETLARKGALGCVQHSARALESAGRPLE